MASYLYYQKDISMFSDVAFDRLCSKMLGEWADIRHRHKALITEDDLRAGSGFAIQSYPALVIGAACWLAKDWRLLPHE
jgi:hypothetical protein